jgi:site-specific recombinase XerD
MTTRNQMLRVRFSDAEWQALQELSESAGMTMSEVVRDHLGKVTVRNRKDEKERTVMLNRINANLNMIARWVNTHRGAAEGIEVVSHLLAIERSIKELSK